VARQKMKTKAFARSRDERKRVEMRFAHLKTHHGFVTLSQTERNLPTTANVVARDFRDLACWLIVQIGPISLNVTTPYRCFRSHCRAIG